MSNEFFDKLVFLPSPIKTFISGNLDLVTNDILENPQGTFTQEISYTHDGSETTSDS